MGSRRRVLLASGLALAVGIGVSNASAVSAADPSVMGVFSAPFEDPAAGYYNVVAPDPNGPQTEHCHNTTDSSGTSYLDCKPAGATEVMLPNGKILYWNALQGTENIQNSTVNEIAATAANDSVKVMDLNGPTWASTNPSDGGANAGTPPSSVGDCLVPGTCTYPGKAYGDLFCADQVLLGNGDLLAVGGTTYFQDPGLPPPSNLGVAELEGLKNGRIYHPDTNTWTQTRDKNGQITEMAYGRWYPSLVTLPDGNVFIASGVTKLIKPVSPGQPPQYNNSNVVQTETYHPATQTFTYNAGTPTTAGGTSADHSLPLFPRLHLLPDGKVFYDGAGQAYNPQGQSTDEALWNMDSVYDPGTKSWTDLGIHALGTPSPGFRGSTFSQMLPLKAPYTSASFLEAGGVLGVTPGSFAATNTSEITTVDTTTGDSKTVTSTGSLNNSRWYPSGVTLPDGTVLTFSGASVDEVVGPGTGMPVRQAELFTPTYDGNGRPTGGTWAGLASANRDRTYHNAAVLLPDGRVLVGGHAPIPNAYGKVQTLPGGFSNNERDPSFEIFSPPYLFRGPRPGIQSVQMPGGYGQPIHITTPDAGRIARVVLVRNTAVTHLVDGDQRTIELPFTVSGNSIVAQGPPGPSIAPPGPYLLFILGTTKNAGELTPSVAAQVSLGTGGNPATNVPETLWTPLGVTLGVGVAGLAMIARRRRLTRTTPQLR